MVRRFVSSANMPAQPAALSKILSPFSVRSRLRLSCKYRADAPSQLTTFSMRLEAVMHMLDHTSTITLPDPPSTYGPFPLRCRDAKLLLPDTRLHCHPGPVRWAASSPFTVTRSGVKNSAFVWASTSATQSELVEVATSSVDHSYPFSGSQSHACPYWSALTSSYSTLLTRWR